MIIVHTETPLCHSIKSVLGGTEIDQIFFCRLMRNRKLSLHLLNSCGLQCSRQQFLRNVCFAGASCFGRFSTHYFGSFPSIGKTLGRFTLTVLVQWYHALNSWLAIRRDFDALRSPTRWCRSGTWVHERWRQIGTSSEGLWTRPFVTCVQCSMTGDALSLFSFSFFVWRH